MAVGIELFENPDDPFHRLTALGRDLSGEVPHEFVVPGGTVVVGCDLGGSERLVAVVGGLRHDEPLDVRDDILGLIPQVVAPIGISGVERLQVLAKITGEGLALLAQRVLEMLDAIEGSRCDDSNLARLLNGASDGVAQPA